MTRWNSFDRVFVILLTFCFVLRAGAEGAAVQQQGLVSTNLNNNASSGTKTQTGYSQVTTGAGLTANTYSVPNATGPAVGTASTGMQQNGTNASDKQGQGANAAMLSAAFSAAMAAMSCPQCPKNPGMCNVCAMSMLGTVAGLAVGSAMKNAQNKSNAQATDVSTAAVKTEDPKVYERQQAETERTVNSVAGNLGKGAGIDAKNLTATLGNGQVIKANELTPDGLAKAGFSKADIKMFNDMLKENGKKAENEILKKAQDNDSNKQGEGGNYLVKAFGNSGETASSGGGGGRGPASIEGATRDYKGTPIGVAAESIWTIMNRRYTHEVEKKKFN